MYLASSIPIPIASFIGGGKRLKRIITNNLDRNRNTGEGWLKRIGSASCHLFDEKGMIMAGTDQTPGNSSGVTTGNGKMYIEKGNGHPRTRKIALFIIACAGVILLVIVLLWSLVPALFAGTWFGYWLDGMIVTLICTYGIFVSYIVFSGYIRKGRSGLKKQPRLNLTFASCAESAIVALEKLLPAPETTGLQGPPFSTCR